MIGLACVVAASTFAAALIGATATRRLPSIRLQLGALALISVVLPLVAVLLSGLVMFHMGADVDVLAVSAVAATASVAGAFLLARTIDANLKRFRQAASDLSSGELSSRVPVEGPREFVDLATSFNLMAGNLEQIFDARSELIAWASHDLRAPIASLQAMIEAIEDGVVTPEHYFTSLRAQVRLLSTLVDDLFELARIDAGVESLDLALVDLGELIAMTVRNYEAESQAKGMLLSFEMHDPDIVVVCEQVKIERVLCNLLTNAIRYTPVGGHVTVSLRRGAGDALVSVEDNGVGIPDDSIERVFEPFWRADAARSSSEGSGLGLAIASGLIAAHGGRIWIESPPSGGTRACFVLPAERAAAPLARANLHDEQISDR